MAHESVSRSRPTVGPSNRSFGLTMAAVFALIGLVPLAVAAGPSFWALAVAAMFATAAMVVPDFLQPLNFLWMRFGTLLHAVVSPLAMGVMFFLVIAPIGLLMRALGQTPLRLDRDKNAGSYWIAREAPKPGSTSLKDQF